MKFLEPRELEALVVKASSESQRNSLHNPRLARLYMQLSDLAECIIAVESRPQRFNPVLNDEKPVPEAVPTPPSSVPEFIVRPKKKD